MANYKSGNMKMFSSYPINFNELILLIAVKICKVYISFNIQLSPSTSCALQKKKKDAATVMV